MGRWKIGTGIVVEHRHWALVLLADCGVCVAEVLVSGIGGWSNTVFGELRGLLGGPKGEDGRGAAMVVG